MNITEKDRKRLSDLFSKLADGGPEAEVAGKMIGTMAKRLGVSGGELQAMVWRGSSTEAAATAPQPDTRPPFRPTAYPDRVHIPFWCSKTGRAAVAIFQNRGRGAKPYQLDHMREIDAETADDSALPPKAAFPDTLLDWTPFGTSTAATPRCPCCNAIFMSGLQCDECNTLCCPGSSYRRGLWFRYRCVCGADGWLGFSGKRKVSAEDATPQGRGDRPDLSHTDTTPRLPAAKGRR
ncbi:hypothetical protein [Novosphingobium sp. FKTRR1]|uniref:hypothetical protein n=1 Tax=Novosphingobium sp. FKTRR1 TaxID=2879118 RepID=UPI001CF0237A|nr:hypothetical protein [Novosphingobium sp. FKTRR1]